MKVDTGRKVADNGAPRRGREPHENKTRSHLVGPWSTRCCVSCHTMQPGLKCRQCGALTLQYHVGNTTAFVLNAERQARAASGVVPVWRGKKLRRGRRPI